MPDWAGCMHNWSIYVFNSCLALPVVVRKSAVRHDNHALSLLTESNQSQRRTLAAQVVFACSFVTLAAQVVFTCLFVTLAQGVSACLLCVVVSLQQII